MTIAELTARISVVGESAVKQSLSRVEASARKMGEAIRTAADATQLLSGVFSIIGKVSGIEAAMAYDAQVRALAAYQKNAEGLQAQLKRLTEIAKLPGLGLSEVMQGVLNLEAAGLSANLAERSVKSFGNALAQAGKGKSELEGVIVALGQISSKGKISAEEIGQMAERLPGIRLLLKDAFGTSNTELIQKMGLTAEAAIEKMVGAAEKLPAATAGFRVTFENLQDALVAMTRPVGTGLLDLFQAAANGGSRLLDILTQMGEQLGQVLSAVGRSGAIEEVLGALMGGTVKLGNDWQKTFAKMVANVLSFTKLIPSYWDAMIKDISGMWSTFADNLGIDLRNSIREQLRDIAEFQAKFLDLIGLKGAAADIRKENAPEVRKTYQGAMEDVQLDYLVTRNRFFNQIMGNLGKGPDFSGFIFGGGAKTKAEAAAGEAEKKAKKTQETLQRIESNTRRSADALDLRTQTLGGGALGKLGVTGTELAGMGMRTQTELSRAKPISADTMVNRGIKQMIQNNLSFAVNGGRSLPVR
jgi:tape measure domain-containing protein